MSDSSPRLDFGARGAIGEPETRLRAEQIGVVLAASVGMAFGYGNLWLCFGLFVRPWSEAFGWTRGEISLGLGLMNVMLVLASPPIGAGFDRWGVRKILLPATGLFALAVGSLAFLHGSLAQLYVTLMFIGALGTVTTPAGYNRVLVEWFNRKRGLAFGLALAGTGVGGMLLPLGLGKLLRSGGTAPAALAFAALAGLVVVPIAFFFLKERGAAQQSAHARNTPTPLREFLSDRRFIKIALAVFSLGIFATGVAVHLAPLLIDRGATPARAALAMTFLAAALTFGRVGAGYLLDKLPAWAVLIPFLGASLLGLLLLALGASGSSAFVCAFLLGMTIGSDFDFLPYLVSRYFPVQSFSRNFAVLFSIMSTGGILGPILMGRIFDRFGNYTYGLWILFVLVALGLTLLVSCGAYPQRETPAPGTVGRT